MGREGGMQVLFGPATPATGTGAWNATSSTTPGAGVRRPLLPEFNGHSPKVRRPNERPAPIPPTTPARTLSDDDLTAGFSALSQKWDSADGWLTHLAETVQQNAAVVEFEQKKLVNVQSGLIQLKSLFESSQAEMSNMMQAGFYQIREDSKASIYEAMGNLDATRQ